MKCGLCVDSDPGPRQIFPEKDQGPGSESTHKPHFMDDLLEAAGAVNVDFPLKTACCGGAHTLSDSDTSTQLVLNILQAAEDSGAEVIATECPTCHSGLEMHQIRAETQFGIKTKVKILYFTQLLGLALGLSARKLAIHENVSDSLDSCTKKACFESRIRDSGIRLGVYRGYTESRILMPESCNGMQRLRISIRALLRRSIPDLGARRDDGTLAVA